MNMLLLQLRSTGSIVVNKDMARAVGLQEAIIFSELLSKYDYFESRELLTENEWFFCTVDDLEYSTTLSKEQQLRAIKKLQELGLIEVTRRGIPAKRYFKIIDDISNLENILKKGKNSVQMAKSVSYIETRQQGGKKTLHQEGEKPYSNNTNNNNTNNNTNIYSNLEKFKKTKYDLLVDKEKLLKKYPKYITNIISENINSDLPSEDYLVNYPSVVLELYKIICEDSPKPRVLSAKRKRALNTLLKSYSFEELLDVFVLVRESDFLSGRAVGSTWKADIDWILNIEKFERIYNGNYSNKKSLTGNLEDDIIQKSGEKVEGVSF